MPQADIMGHVLDSGKLSIPEIESTFNILTLAGSDTVASLLTSMTSQLLRNPTKLRRLVAEIRATFAAEADITMKAINQLPYLDATITESFRLDPPAPGQNPRLVPGPGATICGHYIPGGVSHPPSPSQREQYTPFIMKYRPLFPYRNSARTAPRKTSPTQTPLSQNAGSHPIPRSTSLKPRQTHLSHSLPMQPTEKKPCSRSRSVLVHASGVNSRTSRYGWLCVDYCGLLICRLKGS